MHLLSEKVYARDLMSYGTTDFGARGCRARGTVRRLHEGYAEKGLYDEGYATFPREGMRWDERGQQC